VKIHDTYSRQAYIDDGSGGLTLNCSTFGDEITHDIILHLNKTFVTPIDREDVHALAKALDDVIDAIDDVSTRVPMHRVTKVRPGSAELARVIAAQAAQLVLAAEHLPNMTQFVVTGGSRD
jgi:uncharacterized protein Yka (UPF0111/DUF47 family)